MERVNYFTLLGLTPDASESDIKKAIYAKQSAWNRTNAPHLERYSNEENRKLLPDLKKVMLEEKSRAHEAARWDRETEVLFNNDRAERMVEVRQLLQVFTNTPGYLYQSQVDRFSDIYGGLLEEGELGRMMGEWGLETRPDPATSSPNLDPAVVNEKTLQKYLDDIGKTDLYDFLGKLRNCPLEDLRQTAAVMLDQFRNSGLHSGNNTKWKSVAQRAVTAFRSVETRGKYDHGLKAREAKKAMDGILELAENIALINDRKLDKGHTEQLVSMGQENGLDADEIVQVIVEQAGINGWAITIETGSASLNVENYEDVVVCERGHLNSKLTSSGKERTVCRECMIQIRPFKICRCGRKVRPGANVCPTCGHKFPGQSR